jgi:hypothetical protein
LLEVYQAILPNRFTAVNEAFAPFRPSRFTPLKEFGAGLERAEHPIYYRFLETEAEYFEYHSEEDPPSGHWRIHGLQLPEDVLARVYRDNADRIFPARR